MSQRRRSRTDSGGAAPPDVRHVARAAVRRVPAGAKGDALEGARKLPRGFYERGPRALARSLLGRVLVHDGPRGVRRAGVIVETEAYGGAGDPASHAWRGETPRNRVMFGQAGHAYVYLTYGMHHCFNVVCGARGQAAAVLVRALEPIAGLQHMAARRSTADRLRLTRGPGSLARALGLDRTHDGADLTRGPVWIADLPPRRGGRPVATGPRVGVTRAAERPWRYGLALSPFLSRPLPVRPGAIPAVARRNPR